MQTKIRGGSLPFRVSGVSIRAKTEEGGRAGSDAGGTGAPIYPRSDVVWCTKTCNKRKSFFVCFRSGCPQRRFGEEIRLKTVQVSPGVRSGNREASDKSHVSFFSAAHPEDRSLPPGRSSQALTPFCPGQTQNVAYPGGFVSEMTQGGEQSALGARGRRRSLHESKSEIGKGLARD